MNILSHPHASAQGQYRPPTDISQHFERILCKYARFSALFIIKLSRKIQNNVGAGAKNV